MSVDLLKRNYVYGCIIRNNVYACCQMASGDLLDAD